MYNNEIMKIFKKFLSKFLWWQPVTILLLMFAIGLSSFAAAGSYKTKPSKSSSKSSSEAAVTYVLGQEDCTQAAEESKAALKADALNASVVEQYGSEKEQQTVESEMAEEPQEAVPGEVPQAELTPSIKEDGNYTSKDEVALYIHTYKRLPNNYVTKKLAEQEGWKADGNNLDAVLPGMCIGGGNFGNYEGKLPQDKNRKYYECDIDYEGGIRNSKRLVYSNDGLIFYTDDHYNTFEQLY